MIIYMFKSLKIFKLMTNKDQVHNNSIKTKHLECYLINNNNSLWTKWWWILVTFNINLKWIEEVIWEVEAIEEDIKEAIKTEAHIKTINIKTINIKTINIKTTNIKTTNIKTISIKTINSSNSNLENNKIKIKGKNQYKIINQVNKHQIKIVQVKENKVQTARVKRKRM